MNLCLLLCLLLVFLATVAGDGGVYNIDLSTVEVPTDELHQEEGPGSGPTKTYSTESDFNPFRLADSDEEQFFLGTTFFQGPRKVCFTMDEIALLRAREGYEMLVPKVYPKYLSSNDMALLLVRYWTAVNEVLYHLSDQRTERLMELAFYDTVGAYFHFYLMPVAQVSFYGGHVSLNTVQHLANIKRKCHDVLNTSGNGWRLPPLMNVTEQLEDVEIESVRLEIEAAGTRPDGSNICDQLDLGTGQSQEMSLPLPKLDPLDSNGYLTNIYLPFRENLVCSFRSSRAAAELKRFIGTVRACHSIIEVNPSVYNRKLLEWLQDFVPRHLLDERFYPGLGGILQVQGSLVQTVEEEAKHRSGKRGRSISLWGEAGGGVYEESPYLDARIYVGATMVFSVFFLIVVFVLHCGCCCGEKKKEVRTPKDLELGEISMSMSISKPKRSKRERKITVETAMSPLKVANDRRYYGQLSRSVSSDGWSTSTLGYQFRKKIMPFRFEIPIDRVRKNYKYANLEEDQQPTETKKPGRGK